MVRKFYRGDNENENKLEFRFRAHLLRRSYSFKLNEYEYVFCLHAEFQ